MTRKKILIVDDEKSVRMFLALALESPLYETCQAESGLEAIESLRINSYDLIITDYEMPQMNGLQLMRTIKNQYPSLPVLVVSGNAPAQELIAAGASGFIQKPFGITEFKDIVYSQLFKKNIIGEKKSDRF